MEQRIEQTWNYDLEEAVPGKIYTVALQFRDGSTGVLEGLNLNRGWEPAVPYENDDTFEDRGAKVYAFTEIIVPTYFAAH